MMKKVVKYGIVALFVMLGMASNSCIDDEPYSNDVYGNFDALWKIIDEHYCFFEYKDVDWQAVGKEYRAKLHKDMSIIAFSNIKTWIGKPLAKNTGQNFIRV